MEFQTFFGHGATSSKLLAQIVCYYRIKIGWNSFILKILLPAFGNINAHFIFRINLIREEQKQYCNFNSSKSYLFRTKEQ
jgi:hypothetical protein